MRILSMVLVGVALTFPMQVEAQDKAKAKAKPSAAQDRGALREKCMASSTGSGGGRQAQVRACMERGGK
jgi:hypothetical protein